jgi:YbbR domain-containing protein
VKVVPSNVSIELSPIRQKVVALITDVEGTPAAGFKVQSVKSSRDSITVSGADNLLKKIDTVRAHVVLLGTENHDITKPADIEILDQDGIEIEELNVDTQEEVEVSINIVEQQGSKDVGVKAKLTGAVTNGIVKKIEVDPAVISVYGSKEVLDKLDLVETEPIDLAELAESTTKKAKLVLPNGVSLAENQSAEVSVKVEIEKQ